MRDRFRRKAASMNGESLTADDRFEPHDSRSEFLRMATLKFDVFGRRVLVARREGRWCAYYNGTDGKRRIASAIVIPASVSEDELRQYLADLCHEWATGSHPDVRQL